MATLSSLITVGPSVRTCVLVTALAAAAGTLWAWEGGEEGDLLLAHNSVRLKGSPSQVFAYVSDLQNLAKWFPGVVSFNATDDSDVLAGKKYVEVVDVLSFTEMREEQVVVGYDAPRFISWACSSLLRLRQELHVTRDDKKHSKVTWAVYSRRNNVLLRYTVLPVLRLIYRHRSLNAMFALHAVYRPL